MLRAVLLVKHVGWLYMVRLVNHLAVVAWTVSILPEIFARVVLDWGLVVKLSFIWEFKIVSLHALLNVVRLVDVVLYFLYLLRGFLNSS